MNEMLTVLLQAADPETGDPQIIYRPMLKDFLIDGESFDPKFVIAIRKMEGDGHTYRFNNIGTVDKPLYALQRVDE